ncbi:MAG: hypothetical protein ACK4YK_00050 [Dolichospermum sp.]|jgi:hypothetical protein
MSIVYSEDIELIENVRIEENYDHPQDKAAHEEYGYICYRMCYLNLVTGCARYRIGENCWYIDAFNAKLPDSMPGKGHGTLFLKYLVRKMYQQKVIIVHTVASTMINPDFPEWLIKRGFKQDDLYCPLKQNSRILLPEDAHQLWKK